MKIYDALTGKINKLPDDEVISIYYCGPTVYNDVHIGNIRPAITFDVLHRFLLQQEKKVIVLSNITDIDDKIIKVAQETNKTEPEISEHYFKNYVDVLRSLNILEIPFEKVSTNIENIISIIQKLIDAGYAYVKNGDVYFSVKKYKDYGCISKQNIDSLIKNVRIDNSIHKKSPLDFVLWKKTNVGLNWESPWSKGRPGWHTECVSIINKHLTEQITIHGGGIDLKFPHHENENAQNVALTNKNLAKNWVYVGHVTMNNEKMSKSLNNFVLVKNLLNAYSYEVIRWFFYQTKYENPINFSYELLEQIKKDFIKIKKNINLGIINLFLSSHQVDNSTTQYDNALDEKFSFHLNNDLDFPNAIKEFIEQNKSISSLIKQKNYVDLSKIIVYQVNELQILGIEYKNPLELEHELISKWKDALEQKNYPESDRIRNELISKGII